MSRNVRKLIRAVPALALAFLILRSTSLAEAGDYPGAYLLIPFAFVLFWVVSRQLKVLWNL